MADSAPDKSLAMFESLVNLYGTVDSTDTFAARLGK